MNKALNTLTIIALVAFLNACSDAPEESAPPAQEQEIALPASLEPEPEEAPVAAQPVEEAKTPEPVQAVASTPAPEAEMNLEAITKAAIEAAKTEVESNSFINIDVSKIKDVAEEAAAEVETPEADAEISDDETTETPAEPGPSRT